MQFERLGPYQIGRLLGGGMGLVYEGVNDETREPAAIKVLSVRLASEEGFRERFDVEIETLKKLKHPNIVRLYGYGEQDGYPFYAMELVPGVSLEEAVRNGRRFDWHEVTQIGIKMCRALKHAHDHGVIHRDIKPANILLASDGEVKLSDFGIAKFFGATGLTSTGGVVGTAEYMAPEQADGRPVTHQSDLYSLGGVLYTLLARRPPFVARNVVEMLHLQRSAIPDPVRRHSPDAPEELEDIIAQLLEKDPDKRIRNAMIMARRLEAMEHGLARRESRSEMKVPLAGDPLRTIVTGETGADLPPADSNGMTQPATAGYSIGPASGDAVDRDNLKATIGTDAFVASLPLAPPAEPAKTPVSRFTTVQEEEDRAAAEEPKGPLVSVQTWVLAAALVAVGLLTKYLLLPPNADRLYRRVAALTADRKIDSLIEAEEDIDRFLRYHPKDPRYPELEGFRREINLYRRDKKLQRKAKSKDHELSPAEQTYVAAVQDAQTDPRRAMARLEALVALYDEGRDTPEETQHTLEMAQEQLQRLKRQVESREEEELEFVKQRLDRADELHRETPAAAQAIWRAVIELYGNRENASELVTRAKKGLTSPLPPAAPVSPSDENAPPVAVEAPHRPRP